MSRNVNIKHLFKYLILVLLCNASELRYAQHKFQKSQKNSSSIGLFTPHPNSQKKTTSKKLIPLAPCYLHISNERNHH